MNWWRSPGHVQISSAYARVVDLAGEGCVMPMAASTKSWTLEELHRLPDDGNKYELVRGELFVTPPPTLAHETILSRLARLLDPYVAAHGLGLVYHPRSVVRFHGSEVEPDLLVRHPPIRADANWDTAAVPSLVVEVLSDSTRRRDRIQKRAFYMEAGVGDYWVVDPESGSIASVRPRREDVVAVDEQTWLPGGVSEPLVFAIPPIFT